ncbi:MAG: SMC family ATPase [Chloroflexota bacterium]
MIPVKLSLRNFMCYRDSVPVLDFEGIHVACLSGDNGNGKSALLDAITWALWGEARARSDDDLIHTGEPEMEVEFEFAVGNNLYRVLRKRTKQRRGRAGQTMLELHLKSNGGFQPITGNNVRDTQRKIIEILRMDYPTFTNSAFLLQGRADEFTVKIPSQRKQVLAEILGLFLYDQLEERAKGRVREAERTESVLTSVIKEIDVELAHRNDYEEDLRLKQAELTAIEEHGGKQEAEVAELRQQRKVLEDKKSQLTEAEGRIAEAQRELTEAEKASAEHGKRLQEYEALLSKSAEVQASYAELLAVRQENERLSTIQTKTMEIMRKKHDLEQKVSAARNSLVSDQRMLATGVAQNEAKAEALSSLEAELAKAKVRLEGLTHKEAELKHKKEKALGLSNAIHALQLANEQLRTAMKELKDKIDLLGQGQDRCPLCETELGEEGRRSIQDKYQAEGLAKKESYRCNEKDREEKVREYNALQGQIDVEETGLRKEREAAHANVVRLDNDMQDARKAAEDLMEDRERLAAVEATLAKGDYAADEQAALHVLTKEEVDLGYNPESHTRLRQRLAELDRYDSLSQKLREAERLVPQEREALQQAEAAAARWRSAHEQALGRQKGLLEELALLPQLGGKLKEAEEAWAELRQRQNQSLAVLGAIQQKLAHCAKLEVDRREKTASLGKASHDKSIYDELALAFGKKGIQALIIEAALPEIEEEANQLLARMTDNRMHVKIETQRGTQKGDTIETLDIKISDELGTRNYEMFSGGEAFRINFALRIALSKLLARRAGAPLPTLVIDEGFGTQDGTGRYKLVEAINSIQNDFEKIIVVTHIDDLKDAFPVRIDVVKTEEGSTFSIAMA